MTPAIKLNNSRASFGLFAVIAAVSLLLLACGKSQPLDEDGLPYTEARVELLINDLGRFDVQKSNELYPSESLSKKRLAAFNTLEELGDYAMPAMLARLKQLPQFESQLMARERNGANNQRLSWLLGQKSDLIQLVSKSENPEHGPLLLELADSQIGAGVTKQSSLVLALRRLGAEKEEQIMLDRLFRGPENYVTGAGSLLTRLLTQRDEKDKALAAKVATWPVESRLKGRAILLGTRLGLKNAMLAELKSVLEEDLPTDFQNASHEVGLYLTALAELLPPKQYMEAVTDAPLLQHNELSSVIYAGRTHNLFWWGKESGKQVLANTMIAQQECDNDILALHYMLKHKHIDWLVQSGQVVVNNAQQRQLDPDLEPKYVVNRFNANRIQAAGYRLSTVDGNLVIEKIPGYGMFD